MRKPKEVPSILYAAAILLFGIMMGGIHWLLIGFGPDFGSGVAVGAFLGVGIIFLASRQAREAP